MLELSKCPDFVVNRGHYFGTAFNCRTAERRREASAAAELTTTSAR